jgi:endonuclease YncB( thermonuclease family)
MTRTSLFAALLIAAACTTAPAGHADPVKSIYWSDGDSGRADGVAFRLADVDAPETGGIGSRGGARCEAERVRGFTAKAFILDATKGADLAITYNGEVDDFGRKVATVTVGGKDLGAMGVAAGHLRPYVFNGKRATMPKPNWCP